MSAIYIGSQRPELDTRAAGSDLFTATANSTTSHYFNFDFDCEFNGLEFYAWNPNKGDYLTLYVEYYATPLAKWNRYKKFGKKYNIYPDHVNRVVTIPALPSLGTRVRIDYTCGANAVDFSLNVFQFAAREVVDTSTAQEGEDW